MSQDTGAPIASPQEWVQAELAAGRDVGPETLGGDVLWTTKTLYLRPGYGCLVGGFHIRSTADPVIWGDKNYERLSEINVRIWRDHHAEHIA